MSPSFGGSNGSDNLEKESPTVDETLRVLADPLRRDVIDCCASASGEIIDIYELADLVTTARKEAGEDVDSDDILRVLHHHHLPFLADRGVIVFDSLVGQLRYEPNELLESILRQIRSAESE